MTFTHLHVYSDASILNASGRAKEIVLRAKDLGMSAIALTDQGNVFNAIPFYAEADKQGIKPILGCEFAIVENCFESKKAKMRRTYSIILLAETLEGWKNICRLITASNTGDNSYYRPRIDFNLLRKYTSGIIALVGGMNGIVSKFLYDSKDENGDITDPAAPFRADAMLRQLLNIMPPEQVYLETQNLHLEENEQINDGLRKLALKYGIKVAAAGQVHYIHPSDSEGHRTMRMMQYGGNKSTFFDRQEFFMKTEEEILSDGLPQSEIDCTQEIVNRCNVHIDLKKNRLPVYPYVPNNMNSAEYLRELVLRGVEEYDIGNKPEYMNRLEKELKDIHTMGFDDYFLIVWDVIEWVHKQGFLVGPGRGSAGGSLVSYCLKITNIDPLQYGLIWERFLNVGRVGLPDIDTDIPRSKRAQVIDYIKSRFGRENVAQLVTFNKMTARAVLKDVFRVFNMPFEEANRITNLVPPKNDDHGSITIDEAIIKEPKLAEYEEKYRAWFTIARAIENRFRAIGMHPAAVVIADEPFETAGYPLCKSAKGEDLIFALDMDAVDKLKLLKLDVLGLTTLDVIQDTFDIVKAQKDEALTLGSIPLDDKGAYKLFHEGRLIGIFQLEKSWIKGWSKSIAPNSVEEISDLVSVIRPGPIDCLSRDTKILVNKFSGNKSKPGSTFTYLTVGELYDRHQRVVNKEYGQQFGGKPQMRVCSIDELTHTIVRNKIKRIVKSGKKKLYNVRVQNDYAGRRKQRSSLNIKASMNHRFLTFNGWKRLKDIKRGEYICILKKNNTLSKRNCHAQGWKNFRDIAFQNYVYKCIACDWHEGSLDVNHIDGNRFVNNAPENLCFMCPNHHRMYTEGNLPPGVVKDLINRVRLTNTDDFMYCSVIDMKCVGTEETYDIEMEAPYHNFIAGDFVVHNSGMAESYKNTKRGKEAASYIHPALKPIFKPTYGACLYQEQVIKICNVIAGMSQVDADHVRRAMGKKKPEEMRKWNDAFNKGCAENHDIVVTPEQSADIWSFIEKFSGYGFNKSHGVGYALLAYYTAYLKRNFTTEFICACLRQTEFSPNSFEDISKFINDAKLFGVTVVPPRISQGNTNFNISDSGEIVFALSALKGVGVKSIPAAFKAIKSSGQDFGRWLFESKTAKVNKTVMEATIKCGAMDDFKQPRVRMLADYVLFSGLTDNEIKTISNLLADSLITTWQHGVKELSDEALVHGIREEGHKIPNSRRRETLRGLLNAHQFAEPFDSEPQNLAWEKHYLGIALTGNEADMFRSRDKCIDVAKTGKTGYRVQMSVKVDNIRHIITKKGEGDPMAFMTAGDNTYQLDSFVVFPRQYAQYSHLLEEGNILSVTAVINDRGSLVVDKLERLK